MTTEKRLLTASLVYVLLAIAALILPRIAARGHDGLAAAGVAGAWFLLLGGVALIVSIVALAMTLRKWRQLSAKLRVAGLVPALVSAVAVFVLMVVVGKTDDPGAGLPVAPRAVTAPAALDSSSTPNAIEKH